MGQIGGELAAAPSRGPLGQEFEAVKRSSRRPVPPHPDTVANGGEVAGESQCGMFRHALIIRVTRIRRQAKRGLAPAIHRRCPVSFTTRAPWRRMILDPLLGAHVLCFELSDECSETR